MIRISAMVWYTGGDFRIPAHTSSTSYAMSVPETRSFRMAALICVAADTTAVRSIAQRLRIDGIRTWIAVDELPEGRAAPQELHRVLRNADAVIICLSRRSHNSAGQLDLLMSTSIELLNLFSNGERLTIALRLAQCDIPSELKPTTAIDLFSIQGYTALLNALREHQADLSAAARTTTQHQPPLPTLAPILTLRGHYVLPDLEVQGQQRRFGAGVARGMTLIDERRCLVVSGSGARLVDLENGQSLWEIDNPTRSFALSLHGRLLALASIGRIAIWNLAEQRLQNLCRGHDGRIDALAFAPDERMLISAGVDCTIKLWRADSEQLHQIAPIASIPAHSDRIRALAFSPDGRHFASGSADRTIRVWRMLDRGLAQTMSSSGGGVEAVSFSPDGTQLASGSRDRHARLWDVRSGRCVRIFEAHNGAVESLCFSSDGKSLLTGASDHTARLWRTSDGILLRTLTGHRGPVSAVAFNIGDQAPTTLGEDGSLLVWSEPHETPTVQILPISGSVGALVFSADGSLLAIGDGDGEVLVSPAMETLPPRRRRIEYGGTVDSLAFTDTGRLVSSTADGIIRLCRFDADETIIMLRIHGSHPKTILAPNGNWLATADKERTVQLWRLQTDLRNPGGSFWRVLRGMQGRPMLLQTGAEANVIAVACDDGTIRAWRIVDLEQNQDQPAFEVASPIGRIRSLALSADGKRLAAGSEEGSTAIWEIDNTRLLSVLPKQERAISALAFAPDGQGIAAGDSDGRCYIWRISRSNARQRSNAEPTILRGHAGSITRLSYNPTAALLASGSADGTVRVWKVG
jgi:WD40 repeat protein